MRRRLDEAILELGSTNDRDRIFDGFFAYASSLFDFSVLFLVRGDTAHGRNVHGLGAPPGLVAQIALPVTNGGMLGKAYAAGSAFIARGAVEDSDQRLFGSLGRALPAPLVVPLSVRDRVVGIFLGEGKSDELVRRAEKAGKPPIELAQQDLALLSASVGEMLERLILRKKQPGDTLPPPALHATDPAPIAPAPPSRFDGGAFFGRQSAPPPPATPPVWAARTGAWLLIGGAAVALTGVAAWKMTRPDMQANRIVAAGTTLPGWPHAFDPTSIKEARASWGVDPAAQLTRLEAEVGGNGRVDFGVPVTNPEGIYVRLELATEDIQSEVIIDPQGVHHPRQSPRERCGASVCRAVTPLPTCSVEKVLEGARIAGLGTERALLRYGTDGERGEPEWTVIVPGRGKVRVEAHECKPLARERLRPLPVPLEKIPGSPKDVDPVEIEPLARSQSGLAADAILLEIDAQGVSRLGLVDLGDLSNNITYIFAEPPGLKRRRWRRVQVNHAGMPTPTDEGEFAPLPVRVLSATLPPPRCTFAQAREYLVKNDRMSESGHMTFGPDIASEQTGLWTIKLEGLSVRRTVPDAECEVWARMRTKK